LDVANVYKTDLSSTTNALESKQAALPTDGYFYPFIYVDWFEKPTGIMKNWIVKSLSCVMVNCIPLRS
jgi:hypothetical protein